MVCSDEARRTPYPLNRHEVNLLSRVGKHTSASSTLGCTLAENRVQLITKCAAKRSSRTFLGRCIRRLEQIWLSAGGETHRRAQRHCSRQPGNSSRGSCPRWSNGQQIRFEHSPGPIPSMLIHSILSVILVCMTDVTQILSQIEQGDPSAAEQHGFEA